MKSRSLLVNKIGFSIEYIDKLLQGLKPAEVIFQRNFQKQFVEKFDGVDYDFDARKTMTGGGPRSIDIADIAIASLSLLACHC